MNFPGIELNEGSCYVFNIVGGEKINYGFVVINIIKEKRLNYIECALVKIEKEGIIGINDFKKGLLYTHQVFNPKGNKLGIFVYEFHKNSMEIVKQFKYIGELKLDKKIFMIGTGTTAIPEPLFSKMLKHCELAYPYLDKTPIANVLGD